MQFLSKFEITFVSIMPIIFCFSFSCHNFSPAFFYKYFLPLDYNQDMNALLFKKKKTKLGQDFKPIFVGVFFFFGGQF